MSRKVLVTLSYEKDPKSALDPALEKLQARGTISAVLIPPLSLWQIFFRNLAIGIARGLGFFIGGTVIIGILAYVIQQLVSMNIPYLTELFRQLLAFIRAS